MRIKRYDGQYVHEVIDQIRDELGPDAVVLHTSWRNPAGLKRLLGKPQVEVWAGVREEVEAMPPQSNGADPHAARALALRRAIEAQQSYAAEAVEAANGHAGRNGAVATLPPPAPEPEPEPERRAEPSEDLTVALLREFNQVLARLEGKLDGLGAPAEPDATAPTRLTALTEAGVDRQVAEEIVASAESRSVAEILLDTFQCPGEIDLAHGPKVIALVGPSGVGKTTTAAKLAARYGCESGARVLLASADTQRVGTFEQIRALGQLMELPTWALRSPAEAQAKVQMARQTHDLILVDTAACAAADGEEWERLLDTLIAIDPDEIHVVVSAAMKLKDVERTVRTFREALPLHGAVVTKLDESGDPGLVVDLAWRCLMPISFLGTGHQIPGDLETATPDSLLARVWSTRLDRVLEE